MLAAKDLDLIGAKLDDLLERVCTRDRYGILDINHHERSLIAAFKDWLDENYYEPSAWQPLKPGDPCAGE